MKSLYQTLSLICLCFLFFSCSFNSDPDVSLGKVSVQNLISKQSVIKMTVSNFTKTNGIKRELMGQPVYTMEYTAQIRIEQDCWQKGLGHLLADFDFLENLPSYNNVYYAGMSKTKFYEGAIISCNGKIDFEKTEQGWREINCIMSSLTVVSNPDKQDEIYAKEIKSFDSEDKSSDNSKYTAYGIIKSVDYERNDSWYISIVTPTAKKEMIFLNPRDSEWEKVNLDNLKEGVKIGVIGEWEVWGDGTKGLNAKKIDFL